MRVALLHVSSDFDEETQVYGSHAVKADFGVRAVDRGGKHNMALHDLSAIDDFVSISILDAGIIEGLLPAMPNIPVPSPVLDRTHLSTDEARHDDTIPLRGGPHNEVAETRRDSYVALRSSEHRLARKEAPYTEEE